MSYLAAVPEALAAAAADLTSIGSAVNEASGAAAGSTTGILAAGADEVSVMIAALLSEHGEVYQALSKAAAEFHQQFVQLLDGSAVTYVETELQNAEQNALNAVNAPTEYLFGRPLIGNGANGIPGTGQNGGNGGILWGNGGNGGSGAAGPVDRAASSAT
ncbi:PE-PGRS family protein PE_PGRS26 [Mycobacterium simulans]|uniref:PE-PGRS family protein PE_PGRS26 n=1 Tax=Mycobacterium simulans TaxID=627089 RepID=A0A7Z7IL73_9MYCO|nr:PE-PGRS family protein PE_PGRS26 [Mycobacterium simulans]